MNQKVQVSDTYNTQIDKRLHPTETIPCYTNFKSKEVKIVRLGHPVGVTRMLENKSGSIFGGSTFIPQVIRRIGIPIVVRTNDNSTLEITVPATDELWDAIVDHQLYMATNPMKVKFDVNGIAYDIIVDPVVHDMDSPENRLYSNIKWVEDQEDPDALKTLHKLERNFGANTSFMNHIRKSDSSSGDLSNVKDTALHDLVILSLGDNKDFSIEFKDSSVSDYEAEAIRSKFSTLVKQSKIRTMDFIKDPRAIVSEIRGNLYYIKKL
jgi:hypothetical protein